MKVQKSRYSCSPKALRALTSMIVSRSSTKELRLCESQTLKSWKRRPPTLRIGWKAAIVDQSETGLAWPVPELGRVNPLCTMLLILSRLYGPIGLTLVLLRYHRLM